MHGLFPHIHRSHPVCHFSCDHGRYQFLWKPLPVSYCIVTRRLLIELCAVTSLSLGDWFCLKKPSHTKRAFLHSRHFTNNWLRNVKTATYSICLRQKKLPEFRCNLPQTAAICLRATIFQTPSGLCGHTVYTVYIFHINSSLVTEEFVCQGVALFSLRIL
jgi:hypothetical protein